LNACPYFANSFSHHRPRFIDCIGATSILTRGVVFRGEGRLTVSLNEGKTAAAVAGLGILTTRSWGCRAELSDGRLIPVLPDWKLEPVEVNATFPAALATQPAARALVAYLADELELISISRMGDDRLVFEAVTMKCMCAGLYQVLASFGATQAGGGAMKYADGRGAFLVVNGFTCVTCNYYLLV
jgi:LysR substrate binding domain